MPIYEYACDDCGKQFDLLRPMSQADVAIACEKCGGAHTHRKLSLFFAQSEGQSVAGTSGGCGSCAGGHCQSCSSN
jgi:putative FmdB family regulatory protein